MTLKRGSHRPTDWPSQGSHCVGWGGGALWVSEDIAVPGEGGTGTALWIPESGLPWFLWTCHAGVVDLDRMLHILPGRWALCPSRPKNGGASGAKWTQDHSGLGVCGVSRSFWSWLADGQVVLACVCVCVCMCARRGMFYLPFMGKSYLLDVI